MNSESSICMGCLSVDRKLHYVNDECKKTFCGFIDLLDQTQAVSLCFECLALLQRVMQFKNQVKHAYNYLFSYLLHRSPSKSLSQLSIRNSISFEITRLDSTDTQSLNRNNPVYYYNEIISACLIDNDEIKYEDSDQESNKQYMLIKSDEKPVENDLKYNGTEPVAFIKVEDVEIDYNDGINDQDMVTLDSKEDVFSDSDDEPLNVKSMKKKDKKLSKNKKECPKKQKRTEQASGVVNDPRVAKKLKDLNIDSGHIALVMLTWEEVAEERRLALQSVQYTRHEHRCNSCIVGFNHIHKLHDHNRKHSVEAGNEVCDICTVRCKTRAALASHRRRHRARWVCQWCGARYSVACVAADHCARAHAAPAPAHRCTHCRSTHPSLGALRMHIKSHSSRPECTLCGKTFRDKSSLRTHAFVHRGEKEYACAVCEKRFMFKKQKEIHEITHMEHQNLYCLQCDVTFKNQTSFYQHMKYNLKHIDPADIKHACPLCDKKFVKAKRLEEHNLAVHLKLAPIKCTLPDCTFACPSRAALRSHARLAHRGACKLRTHVCHYCGRTYQSKKSLDSHLRSHSATPSLPPAPVVRTRSVEAPA